MSPPAAHLQIPLRGSVTRTISTIVLHCSATPSGRRLGGEPGSLSFRSAVRVIDGWHARRGFRRNTHWVARFNPTLPSIGYHYVIDVDGRLATGRHLAEPGAHAAGHNFGSVGVCMVGGAEQDARYSAAQWDALAELVSALALELGVPLQHVQGAGAGVCGHRDLSPDADGDGRVQRHEWLKTCPGFDVSAWLERGLRPSERNLLAQAPVR